MNIIPIVMVKSIMVKGRYDVLNQDAEIIDFRFSKKSAINYSKKHDIHLYTHHMESCSCPNC